jgi:hypothetical protein
MARSVHEYQLGTITEDDLNIIVTEYESQTDATLAVFFADLLSNQDNRTERDRQPPGGDQGWVLPHDLQAYPEFVTASRSTISVVQRKQ